MKLDLGVGMILISILMLYIVVGSVDNMLPDTKFQDVVILLMFGMVALVVGLLGYSYMIKD